jgi:hypothetical protein
MSKQTAVIWFNQQLIDRQNGNGDSRSWDKILQQALQIEREQIDNFIDFINERHFNQFIISKDEAEIYYNETYGGQDE